MDKEPDFPPFPDRFYLVLQRMIDRFTREDQAAQEGRAE